jgi:hypothetical protein
VHRFSRRLVLGFSIGLATCPQDLIQLGMSTRPVDHAHWKLYANRVKDR